MAKNDHKGGASPEAEKLIADFFALGVVGYVALGAGQDVVMRMAPAVEGMTQTADDSNFFEELLVNPTLLKLAGQRGRLDCGGLNYIAIGYGDFIQFIAPMEGGHVSLGVASETDVPRLAGRVREVLDRNGRLLKSPQRWLHQAM